MTARPRVGGGEHPLYAFLAVSPTAVLVVDEAGTIAYANGKALETFGYSVEELMGQAVEMLLPPQRAAEHERHRATYMVRPTGLLMGRGRNLKARRKDGSLLSIETSLVPMERNGQRLVVASVTDITERLEGEELLREINRCYLTLSQMNQAIARAADAPSIFAQTCEIAVTQGGYRGAWVAQRGKGFAVVQAASAGLLDDYVARLGVNTDPDDPRGRGPIGVVLREGGDSYYSQEFGADQATLPWHELAESYGIRSAATLPIRQGGSVVASLSLYSEKSHAFTDEVRLLLEGMVENVSFALDRFDAELHLIAVARERTQLSKRLVEAQEIERARIAADVHDESVQSLAALDLRLGLLKRQLTASGHEAAASVDEIHHTVAVIAADLRDLLFELEPAGEGQILAVMLEEAAAHVFADSDCCWSMNLDTDHWDESSVLSSTSRGQSLRIVKEALLNVRQHSGAALVVINVVAETDGLRVEVVDNGSGFEVGPGASAPGHRGLANMIDRAAVSGGWCDVESNGSGTVVRFWLPYADPSENEQRPDLPKQAATGQR